MDAYDAIVLAGGGGRRLGGVDKASLQVAARPLIEHALAAVRGAARIVVVGPDRRLPPEVTLVSEEPPGGGPVAAIAAAIDTLSSPLVVVLACDMPLVTAATVERLVAAARAGPAGSAGALLVDGRRRRQYLSAAYRRTHLVQALNQLGAPDGAAMRDVVHRLTVIELESDPEVTIDCDTWVDVEHCRQILEGR